MILFHGGVPGKKPGDVLVPHAPNVVDGCAICVARATGEDWTDANGNVIDPATKTQMVYACADRPYARFYASKYPMGDLYRIELLGDVVKSSEDHWLTWCASEARVVSVLERCVRLTDAQRRTLVRKWRRLDRESGALMVNALPSPAWEAGIRFPQ